MSPREIIQKTFQFEDTNIVPYWIPIYETVQHRLDEYYDSKAWRDRLVPYMMGGHSVGGYGTKDLGGGLQRDPFGTVLQSGSILHLEKAPLESPSMDGYQWPKAENLADWDALAEQYESTSQSFRLCGMSFGFFERSWLLRGFQSMLMDMIEHPQFVHDLMDGYLKLRLEVIDLIIERVPVEGIFDGGDDCDQRGPIMGLDRWREFIKPRLARVIEHVHQKGLPVVAHMCGNVTELIDDLLAMDLDALESLQSEAMDIYELKRKTTGKMVLIGGMGVQSILPFGTPKEVRAETKKLISEMGRGGGYVLAPAKPIMEDVPSKNAAAFIETACES